MMRNTMMLTAILLAACSTKSDPPIGVPATDVTYHGQLRAVLEQRCVGCHEAGGIGPFALDTYDGLKATAPAVVASVEAKRMPPWMPDPQCRHFRDERVLSPEEIALFSTWVAGGMQEGDEADYVNETSRGLSLVEVLGEPSATLSSAQPYQPNSERPDDYRCFVLDHEFPEETFMVASNVVPDQRALVHHVIVFLVEPQFVPQVEARAASETEEGYACFGGAGAGSPTPIVGWVPGNVPVISTQEAMIRIPAGSKLVMQMHYNTLGGPAMPDQTKVDLWLTNERPNNLLIPIFFPHLGIEVAAGDAASKQERVFTNNSNEPWVIVSTSPHMHLLGQKFRTTKVATDGAEQCVIDIPKWDFNWQQGYVFEPGDELVVQPGESLRLECTYDNSAANQPVVNGEQLPPRDVRWGEGTLDEMCLNTLVFVEPYTPYQGGGPVCEGFQSCYDDCKSPRFPMTGCILQCGATNGCANCLLNGIVPCTASSCGAQSARMLECFDECADSSDPNCIGTNCVAPILTFDACAAPKIDAGECDAEIAGCDVTL